MKKRNLGTVLVCVSVLSVVAPAVASADDGVGTGVITYKGKGTDPKDPANITPAIDPDEVGPNAVTGQLKDGKGQTLHAGELTLDAVSPLDFGTQTIATTAQTYKVVNKALITPGKFVAPTGTQPTAQFQATPGATDIERGHFVQLTDARADSIDPATGAVTAVNDGWKLSAKLSKQFSLTTTGATPTTYTLNGATIDYSNILRNHTAGQGATLVAPAFTLAFNQAVDVASALKATARGTHTLQFGQVGDHYANTQSTYAGSATLADNIDKAKAVASGTDSYENSVLLNVPAGNNIQKAAYSAEITWSVVTAP